MKKLLLAATAVLVLSPLGWAESYPSEGTKSYTSIFGIGGDSIYDNRPYAGIGYTYMDASGRYEEGREEFEYDYIANALTITAGYGFNRYIAIEGRYTRSLGDINFDATFAGVDLGQDLDGDMSNIGLYIKPMYTTPQLSAYLLLGVGEFSMDIDGIDDDFSASGFQWGLGVSFHGGEHLDIFLDYVRMYDDSVNYMFDYYGVDVSVDSYNVGLSYKF
jgi:hypothetical protein